MGALVVVGGPLHAARPHDYILQPAGLQVLLGPPLLDQDAAEQVQCTCMCLPPQEQVAGGAAAVRFLLPWQSIIFTRLLPLCFYGPLILRVPSISLDRYQSSQESNIVVARRILRYIRDSGLADLQSLPNELTDRQHRVLYRAKFRTQSH